MSERALRFDRLYAGDIDPWRFRTSEYEREKYRATIAALSRPHYCLGIEAGCSIGELTWLLADRCDHVIGIDVSRVAIEEAVRRHADRSNISFMQGELPDKWPNAPVDLIVLSEVLYFLSPGEIDELAERLAPRCRDGAECVLVNYLDQTSEALQGSEAADLFIAAMKKRLNCKSRSHLSKSSYRIDTLVAD